MINNYFDSPYTFEYTELTKFSEIDIKKYCNCIKNNFQKRFLLGA